MAQILANGLVQFNDGRVLYSDTVLTGQDFMELVPLLSQIDPVLGRSAMVGFPFISGGGGGGGGTPGAAGPQGVTGLSGGGTGPQGVTGVEGQTGPSGGPVGATGVQGATGIQGQTGVQGTTGVQGATGLQSQTGIQGATGIQGQTGVQGTTGVQGQTGIQGQTGLQGATGVGAINVALFTFTHTTGTAGTGALGFTPRFAIYLGVNNNVAGAVEGFMASGFATGTGALARAAAVGIQSNGVVLNSATLFNDDDAIAGNTGFTATQVDTGNGFNTAELDVTAFSAAGIDLTWSVAVNAHFANLLVVG